MLTPVGAALERHPAAHGPSHHHYYYMIFVALAERYCHLDR